MCSIRSINRSPLREWRLRWWRNNGSASLLHHRRGMSASTACRGDVCMRATNHRALPLQRQHFWSCAEPLCARMRVRAGGFGGSWRCTITKGASRHRETNTRAPVRALHLVMHNMRILPASTPLSENPTDTPQEQNGTTAGAGSRVYTCWRLCAPRKCSLVPYCRSWVVRWKKKGGKWHV